MHQSKFWSAALGCLALLGFSSDAWATHKAWLLIDSGTSCQPSLSGPDVVYSYGAIRNNGTSTKGVECPVTLAGRYGASTSVVGFFPMTQSMRARSGRVHVYDGNSSQNVSCFAYTLASNGASYYSSSVSSSGLGGQSLIIHNDPQGAPGTWGNTMANIDVAIRALGYHCSLPTETFVSGYDVNLCQVSSSECHV